MTSGRLSAGVTLSTTRSRRISCDAPGERGGCDAQYLDALSKRTIDNVVNTTMSKIEGSEISGMFTSSQQIRKLEDYHHRLFHTLLCHIQYCHTHTHNIFTHTHHFHTQLIQYNKYIQIQHCHIQLCHTCTHNSVRQHSVAHNVACNSADKSPSHATLSHTRLSHPTVWLVVWNMNFIFPYIGNNPPN